VSKEQVINIANLVLEKGGDKMNKELLEMLSKLGIAFEEGKEYSIEEINSLVEAWGKKTQEEMDALKAAATPIAGTSEVFMTTEQVKEKLGKDFTADEVLSLAKEGQDYLKKISDEALAMGVRAMGNDFKKETWEKTFTTMPSKDILDITATWETQAKAGIPAGRYTDASAGHQKTTSAPDEAYKVGK
jgi:hypothetical protein